MAIDRSGRQLNFVLNFSNQIDKINLTGVQIVDRIRKGWLNEVQIQTLLAAETDSNYRAIWTLMADCGLRMEEVRSLKGSSLTEPTDGHDIGQTIRVEGKRGKIRYLEMTSRCRNALAYIKSTRNKPLFARTPRAIQLRFKRTAARVGLPDYLSPHSLRHSYATRLLDGGMSIYAVKELMGHESILTTEKYLHVTSGVIGAARSTLDREANRIDQTSRQNGLNF